MKYQPFNRLSEDMKIYDFYNKVTNPIRGHHIGDHWPINVIVQHVEAHLVAREKVTVQVNGYRLQLHGLSGGICTQLLRNQPYEPLTTRVLDKLLPLATDAIDVGANVGYYTLLMSTHVNGHVWAFEPERKNFSALSNNIALNYRRNVTAMPLAVSDTPSEEGTLFVSGLESGEHSLVLARHLKNTQSVRVVTLDDWAERPVHFIKTDAEGNDFKVMLGAKRLLANHSDVVLLTEFWPEGLQKSGYSARAYWEFLLGYFKRIVVIDELGKQIVHTDLQEAIQRASKGLSVNLLCSNEEVI